MSANTPPEPRGDGGAAARAPIEIIPASLAGARILVVEDEHLVALDIQQMLAQIGHVPVLAYSGEEALERVAEQHFDLVLMDVKLKGTLDGIEVAARIHRTGDVPVIYLTAYADNHTLERARATEPYGYLLKPFQERELKAAIEMTLQRHATERARLQEEQVRRFLAEVTARLTSSLDYRAVASNASELLVPHHADLCLIHLIEHEDVVADLTVCRPDPGQPERAVWPRSPLVETVERTGRPELMTQLLGTDAVREALGAHLVATMGELGARSLVCVPLRTRGEILGALAVVAGRTRPRFGPDELAFFEDFAHRLAIALDNAVLYHRAEHAVRMRDDVLAIVSHDLRSPLATILMEVERLPPEPGLRRPASAIGQAARRMNRLIGDLLDASAINAGALRLDVDHHDLDDLVGEAVSMFRVQAELRGLHLISELAAPGVRVRCDRDRIVQVLSNLIGNAVKFTPAGGTVTVAASPAGDGMLVVEVRDTGPGIPAEQLPRLFQKYWRAHTDRTGAGLGLFIARGILAAHGTKLSVETEVGKGSRFDFQLPVAEG